MTISVNVQGDMSKIIRHLNATTEKFIPQVATQAINAVAANARRAANKEAARELRLPLSIIRKRFDRNGNAKSDRTVFFKATRFKPVALIRVYNRGIAIHQIKTGKGQNSKGVRAKGGRLYKGAFVVKGGGRARGLVLKRRTDKRYPLFAPRLSVRRTLEDAYNRYLTGPQARVAFRREFNIRMRRRLERSKPR